MAENSKIAWTDHTFNPWIGYGAHWGSGKACRRTSTANWRKPLAWNRNACWFRECADCGWRGESMGGVCHHYCGTDTAPVRQRVFCASLADVFDNEVPQAWRADLFDLIERTPNLDWLLLTKRIGNAAAMMQEVAARLFWLEHLDAPALPKNVWLGATICNQEEADRDIPKLLKIPAAGRFLSIEPMLGPVDLTNVKFDWATRMNVLFGCGISTRSRAQSIPNAFCEKLDWVIVGGESGRNARVMHPDWPRSLRDQCKEAGVPFFFKQTGGLRGGCDLLDGVEYKQFPETGI